MNTYVAIICLAIAMTGCAGSESTYTRFTHACEARHGFVADVGGTLSNRQCIVNNQILYIPEEAY